MQSTDLAARYVFGSNALDGITLSFQQTQEILGQAGSIDPETELKGADGKTFEAAIVLGHSKALKLLHERVLAGGFAAEELIKSLHSAMMEDLLLSAGEYREVALRVKGLLIPSPPHSLEERMVALLNLVNVGLEKASDKNQLAWRVHHEFYTIHPFIEGNGRIARLLLNYVRLRAGLGLSLLGPAQREQYGRAIIEFQKQKIAKAKRKAGQ